MNLLITGGAGFIGSNFIRYILKKYPNYKVVNYDKLTYAGNLGNLKDVEDNKNYSFVKGDICDKRKVLETVKENKIQTIINFAAETHVDRSIDGPDTFIQTNIVGTQVLLDVTMEACLDLFFQVSTDEVYGHLGETGKFTEETHLAPRSPYSASKTSSDLLTLAYFATYNLPVKISRCSNNYGPYQYPEKLIPLFIERILKKEKIPLYGDGLNVRDWIHVDDHNKGVDTILHKGKVGEVYNLGGAQEKTNLEITKIILKELGESESLITYVEDRKGHDRRYAVDFSKIERELGWKPEINFEEGMKAVVNWYKNKYLT